MKRLVCIIAVCISVVLLVFAFLFTPIIKKPVLIYINCVNEHRSVHVVNDLEKIDMRGGKNYNFFLNNLKYCKNLNTLTCDATELPDQSLKFLSGTKLKSLDLIFGGWNWEELLQCSTVENLSIFYSDFDNINYLKNMSKLNDLYIESDVKIDCNDISQLSSLENLTLYSPEVDIKQISSAKKIKTLYVSSKKINSLDQIGILDNLESLCLANENTSGIDLMALTKLKKLKELRILNCKIKNSDEEIKKYTDLYFSKIKKFSIE